MGKENIFTGKKLRLGKVRMNIVDTGRGYPVVLIHGWTNNWKGFVPMARILRKKYRVIMVDLLGYGDSDELQKYSLKIEAVYIKKLVDKLGLDHFCLGALSMGTYVAGKFHELYPSRADSIVLISPTFEEGSRKMFFSRNFFGAVHRNGLASQVVKKIVDRKAYAYAVSKYVNMHHFDWGLIKEYGLEGKRKMTAKAYTEIGLEMAKNNVAEMIKDNKIPIKILFGEYDKLCNLEKAVKVLKGKGKYFFGEVSDSGHLVNLEKPAETAGEIDNFISVNKLDGEKCQ